MQVNETTQGEKLELYKEVKQEATEGKTAYGCYNVSESRS